MNTERKYGEYSVLLGSRFLKHDHFNVSQLKLFLLDVLSCLTSQFIFLILILALEAARILNNLTDQKVNISATITLLCDAAGIPNPSVLWTKNNHTVVEGSGEMSTFQSSVTHFMSLHCS